MSFSLSAGFRLIRPVNVLVGAASVFVGAFVTGALRPPGAIVLACISGALIMAGGNVINDYCDIEIDRVNKADRPLPSGRISPGHALRLSIILFVLGIFFSIFINSAALLIAIFVALGLVFYSFRLKRTLLAGNIAVSLFSALAFLYGSLAVDRWQQALIPAGFAFLFHLGREIVKDVQDQAADLTGAATTLPIRFGTRTALAVASGVFSLLILATLVPYCMSMYDDLYLPVVLVGVDLVIVIMLYLMWTNPSPESLGRVSNILKADMVVGLLALYLGIPKA